MDLKRVSPEHGWGAYSFADPKVASGLGWSPDAVPDRPVSIV